MNTSLIYFSIVFLLIAVAKTATAIENPSSTHGFKTVGIWESGDDQNWLISQGSTADKDHYYFATASGSLSWSYLITKDRGPNGAQITTEQRDVFSVKFAADFATTSPAIATRFIVYVNATEQSMKGWYSSANISGTVNL